MTQEQRERLLELREWLTGSSTGPDQKMVYLSEALGIIARLVMTTRLRSTTARLRICKTTSRDWKVVSRRKTMPKTVRRRRVRVAPKPTPLEQTGNYLLETADEIFKRSAGLDTAVRDSIAQGLAYIVHAGNDCLSSGRSIPFTQWIGAIEWSTAEWFRARGFVEWFCVGAASLFRTSRPREIHMDNIAAVRLKKNGK